MRYNQMRCLLRALSLCTCFGILHFQRAEGEKVDRPNFSGSWTLDVRASNSIDPLMKYIEAGPLERAYAAWAPLQTTMLQNGDELIVATRGPGFALDQTLYLDGRIDRDNLRLFGAASLNAKTTWSKDYRQLVEIHQIKTAQGKDGQLIIERSLADQGNTLVVVLTVRLNNQPDKTVARQIWHKDV